MRWSLIALLFAATFVVEGVFSVPTDVSSLEKRAGARSRKPTKLTAGSLKKSSKTYRKNALSGKTYTKSKTRGKVKSVKTPKSPPKNKDADHILESQTVKKALNKGGYHTTKQLGSKAHKGIKDALNHSKNMAYVDKDINRKKGQATKAALSGKKPNVSPHVKDYVKRTSAAGKSTAKAIDGVLKKHGVKGVSVQKEHQGVLKHMGVKRELALNDLD
ncbi:hypothetical protein CPB84DRAFT_1774579 [Gymnopilus junonius]|uniref:Uncharacterized protein n=1 Tax=Gymnopilus junonius TaxID=109634 RepID=A0A9P5NS05_GYMJU|nr:hypothetical protein CPB84DRAFT_1774579 [Gymnopilus junonius]